MPGAYLGAALAGGRLRFRKAAPSLSEVEALAKKVAPKLAKAILDALTAQQSLVSLQAIADALASGNVDKVIAALDLAHTEQAMASVTTGLQNVTWAGGALGATQVNAAVRGIAFAFDQLNPRLITWLQQYSLGLIRQVNDETRDAIRGNLISAMYEGRGPRDAARQIRQVVGLTEKQAKAVQNFRKELETFHARRSAASWGLGQKIDRAPGGAQVFKPDADGSPMDGIDLRRLRDYRFDGQLKAALETGKPLTKAQIDKMVDGYARKYLKYRSETIARTEALRATNVGVQDAWRQAIETQKVPEHTTRRRWIVSPDERLCSTCQPVPGMNPKRGVRFAEPFATPKGPAFLPPLHPNCRCTVFVRVYEPSQLA